MITVTYYKSGSVGVQCPPGEALYALGMKPANHLPPAIRYELRVEKDFFGYGAVVFISNELCGTAMLENIIYVEER